MLGLVQEAERMRIEAIDVLGGQRAVLDAAPSERRGLFRERVVEPLRPFWEPMMARMPLDPDDPLAFMGVYGPEHDAAAGLAGLAMLEQAGSAAACVDALAAAERALRPDEHGVPVERLLFALAMTAPRPGDDAGYSGAGNIPGTVIVTVWPSAYNLPKLPAAAAHELHHGVRFRAQPANWPNGVPVGDYVVLEGLAEAFAADLCGEENLGPWTRRLTDAQAEALKPIFRPALETTGFDVIREYVFGSERLGVPPFAGYAVGYRIARAFLARSGVSSAEATYLPWREVVAGSGFFD
jgi:uncharacterized protein YjaZ